MAVAIERLLAAEAWTQARRQIRSELKSAPDEHWLLSRLALTYYEQRRYSEALELETQALQLAPGCPLSLWGLAGALHMLGREVEATAVYQRLIRRGANRLARGRCGEGKSWARGLVADSWFRLGQIRESRGDVHGALRAFARHLKLRASSASIYPASEARSRLKSLRASGAQ